MKLFPPPSVVFPNKDVADTGRFGSTYDGGGGDASLIRDEGVALRRPMGEGSPPCTELPKVILVIDAALVLSNCGRV
jgi:hypothetical protein